MVTSPIAKWHPKSNDVAEGDVNSAALKAALSMSRSGSLVVSQWLNRRWRMGRVMGSLGSGLTPDEACWRLTPLEIYSSLGNVVPSVMGSWEAILKAEQN